MAVGGEGRVAGGGGEGEGRRGRGTGGGWVNVYDRCNRRGAPTRWRVMATRNPGK